MKPYVTVELDKPRRLRYGINALCMIEDILGKPLTKLDTDNLSIKDMRTVIYCGLAGDDKELTPEKVGDLIDEYSSLEEISKQMTEALKLSFGPKNTQGPTGGN